MEIYEPNAKNDALLLQWWTRMTESGELDDVFAPQVARSLVGFLNIFQQPTVLFWLVDEDGVAVAIWFEQFMENLAMGMWARPDYRHGKWWDALIETLRSVFAVAPLVLYMTKRRHVIESGLRVGFTELGEVPFLYRGQTGWVAYLTRATFEERYGISNRDRQ